MSNASSASVVQLRRATIEDAGVCGRICFEAFATINNQHNFPPELPAPEAGIGLLSMLFTHPSFYCVVALINGRIVGSNCLDERSAIAGIGPLTIAPDAQDQGVGRKLMEAVMARGQERSAPGLRLLQAAFHNRSLGLYAKLGFQVRELMSVMQGSPPEFTAGGFHVRRATENDVNAANRLCERVHGHNRAGELRDGIAQGSAFVVERQGSITGYASGFGYFGHAVADSNLSLQALIAAAGRFEGPGIIVPTRNAELFRWCLTSGLRVVHPMTLMTVGLYNEPAGSYLPSILY
jgi:GNAT superfamily N-acetyltransferase